MPPDPAVNVRFVGQRSLDIENGQITGRLKDIPHPASTTGFRGPTATVGGPQTHGPGRAVTCGKAQPGQVAAVSHPCPSALLRGVSILNTTQEAGQ
ncbi:hypothetical protein I3F55_18460 [Streptomyces sp. MUM 16J]|nr:hypothetical protein [Streptomyces sp. MUM 16J]